MICLIAALAALAGVASPTAASDGVRFLDRTSGSGLQHVTWSGGPDKNHILESAGNGLLALDYDRDSWPDLYLVSAFQFTAEAAEPHSNRLYRNRRDLTFSEVTEAAGVTSRAFGSGGCVGDYDADGLPDMYITNLGEDMLLRNNGDGTFSSATHDAGVSAPGWSTGAAFFDADGDGDQDLFVASYVRTDVQQARHATRHRMWRGRVAVLDGPRGLPGDENRFFRNNGNGTFTEATDVAGLDDLADTYSFGVVAFDHDGDGDQDLYVANDSQRNALYDNAGDGIFHEVGALTGLGFNANGVEQGSMGVAIGDYDGDLLPDVAVTNFAHDNYTLYRDLGDGLFLDVSFDTGIAVATFTPLGWGVLFLDADQDADLDLFFSNGHLYTQVDSDPSLGESYRQRNQLMINDGGHFREVADAGPGLQVVASSRGAVSVDLDRDGDLDIVVSNQDELPTLLENSTEALGNWLSIELIDDIGDRSALGARIELDAGGISQVRWILSGGTYMSQSELRAHFGLGSADRADRVTVTWPDGTVEHFEDLAGNQSWQIKRGRPPRPLGAAR